MKTDQLTIIFTLALEKSQRESLRRGIQCFECQGEIIKEDSKGKGVEMLMGEIALTHLGFRCSDCQNNMIPWLGR